MNKTQKLTGHFVIMCVPVTVIPEKILDNLAEVHHRARDIMFDKSQHSI
jgi:hypothetical protein